MMGLRAKMEPIKIDGPYDAEILRKSESSDLVVIFSHNLRHALSSYPYDQNALFVKERRQKYFLADAAAAALSLMDRVRSDGFERVIFIGTSKGGFGALLWAGLSAKEDRSRIYRALAFSPQTSLWPPNPKLYFPSYSELLANQDTNLRKNLRRHGNLSFIRGIKNLDATIVYGATNVVDAEEAKRLAGRSVELIALPLGIHASLTPFVHKRDTETEISQLAERLYINAEKDIDLRSSLPKDKQDFIAALANIDSAVSLGDLVADRISRTSRQRLILKALKRLGFSRSIVRLQKGT